IYTGAMPASTIVSGACAEIATGAPLPSGADAVVMVEETANAGGAEVSVFAKADAGLNVSPRGGGIARGAPGIAAGERLTPGRTGALAAVGCTSIEVYARPRVAILSTGNEVIEPGERLAPGQIFDVNRFTLSVIVGAHGGVADPRPAVHDDLDALGAA